MSTRSSLRPQPVVTNGDMALSSLTSDVTILQSLTVGTYSYSWAGSSPVGAIALQISNDYKLSADGRTVENAGTWTSVTLDLNGTLVDAIPITGNSGNGIIEWTTGAYAIRTVYTKTSGTGTLNVIFNGKVS